MDTVKDPVRNSTAKNRNSTSLHISEPTSLSTLIVWNISKAREKSPTLNLKEAIVSAQNRLDQISDAGDIQTVWSDNTYERHLACALLAWQQLGHRDADSLCRFIEKKTTKIEELPCELSSSREPFDVESLSRTSKESKMSKQTVSPDIVSTSQDSEESRYEEARCFSSFNSFSMGPVVKLPVESKVVMRLENTSRGGRSGGQGRKKPPEKDIKSKIDQACCLDTVCAERLAAMDATTTELRRRAGTLARREAERVELLERAEAAWKDLELGYQRRLTLAEEKEEDISKQLTKMLEERVKYKEAFAVLAQELKDRGIKAELERTRLSELEKHVCDRACLRMRVSEESAKGDALVAEQACKAAQLDRDLQFKEEQARRNMMALQNEVSALRSLTSEAERATRSELDALRVQIAAVSNRLLEEADRTGITKAELENLREEKMDIIKDLDGCKLMCDERMQGRMDELKKKRDQLAKLKEKVMDCQCKLPINIAVEVKRTPSLAALCKCTPEDKILESCSCTSMRTKLLGNLFADLFSGLHAELTGAVIQMPCQLLKCLEDKHNWDRATVVKSNLKDYFSKLLVGELDIAIATSIENYHAKWVGLSCADRIKMTPGAEDDPAQEGWQRRAIERRAQKLAEQLADQLFQERADELTRRARDLMEASPPPCACDVKAKLPEGCTCGKHAMPDEQAAGSETVVYWHQASQDLTQLRPQSDNKKNPIRKDYLKTIVDKEKFTQLTSVAGSQKAHRRVHGADSKKNDVSVKNDPTASGVVTPKSWRQAMQDVTLLRFQIEDLKKESIKKEDLRLMENKIAKIIQRASAGTSSNNPNLKYFDDGNLAREASKFSKVNRAMNPTGLRISDIIKPITKKNMFGSISKEINTKPIINRGIMPYKKKNPAYTVNMCLCRTRRQEQKELEKRKLETDGCKEKKSKDTVSQVPNSVSPYRPIISCFLSQDISARSYCKRNDEVSCPSNCVCFHKTPSNTSIDRLLDTLAKWKGDLDASFTDTYLDNNSCCSCSKINHPSRITFESKTCFNSKINSQEIPLQKSQNLLRKQGSTHKTILEPPNTNLFGKSSAAEPTGPVVTTDSVYMGAVNLDKSHEELCNCNHVSKKKTPLKCISSSNCACEKTHVEENEGQMMYVKKEISVIQTKQDRRVKDIVVLPNTPKNKESKNTQLPEKDMNSNMTVKKKDDRAFKTSDYQINFLGVTLVDVHPQTKNQVLIESDNTGLNKNNILQNISSPYRKHYLDDKKIEHYQQIYSKENNNYPVPLQTSFTNSIGKKNILLNNDDNLNNNMEPNCLKNNDMKRKKISKSHYENKDNNENINKYILMSDMYKSDVSSLHKNIKHKNSDFGYKTASEQNISKIDCNTDQLQKEINTIASYSHESEITKKSYDTVSDSDQLFDKRINEANSPVEDLPNEIIRKKQSSSSNEILKTTPIIQMPCQCSIRLDEFKKLIDANFMKNTTNEDVALDVPSLKFFKERVESCVCCSKLNNDSCKDLEDNTFHLLEEYLKKKLNEFRLSACSSFCISAEEEEKIFDIIVKRVKRLISDSTNQIACKCSTEERKSQGSWNRAYGLLQEYLKIKIKKVQCSCLLAEDNKDTILPDVLEKISNLIEYDFQRLKNVCRCKNYSKQENKNNSKNNNAKQVNFAAELPEKDHNVMFQTNFSKFASLDDSAYQAIQTNRLNQRQKTQIPLTLAVNDASYNPQESNEINYNVNGSIHSFRKLANKCLNEPENNINVSTRHANCTKITDAISTEMTFEHLEMNYLVDMSIEKTNKTEKLKPNEPTGNLNESRNHPSNFVNLDSINSNGKQEYLCSSCNRIYHKDGTSLLNNYDLQNSKGISPKRQDSPITNSREVPYFGYTISCSCDETLGPCICPKNTTNTDTEMINDLWKKSTLDEKFYEKVSYILPKQTKISKTQIVHESVKSHMPEEAKLSDVLKKKPSKESLKSEATCCVNSEPEPIVLKASVYNVVQTNAETNTLKDNVSEETDCSNNYDVDWCAYDLQQCDPSKHLDSNRLKRSIYFPASITDFDKQPKENVSNQHTSRNFNEHVCHCERVPICHVKMLVENIEAKLANANCTCDALKPKVCPVHSKMC